jgi:transposase InsO family protein
MDSWGPVEPSLQGTNQFFGAFCRSTSFALGRPIRSTTEILLTTEQFLKAIRAWGYSVVEIRADNGATFRLAAFSKLCSDRGIRLRFSAPYSPHLNALAKRPWRT